MSAATADFRVMQRAWKIEVEANEGDFANPDMESMRHCFYVKPDAPSPGCSSRLGATAIRRGRRGRNGRKRRYGV